MESRQIDNAEKLIEVMRRLPYPVTIITAAAGSEKRGITIGSFTSLSMEPPLVSFNVTKDSQMHEILQQAQRFVVHVPGPDQAELCRRFALPDQTGREQFDGLNIKQKDGGPPVIDGMNAEVYCRKHDQIDAGDHSIFVGEVTGVLRHSDEASIFYYDGEYRKLNGR